MTECNSQRPFVFASCQGPAPSGDFGQSCLMAHALRPWICLWVRGDMACPPLLRRTLGMCLCVFMYYDVAFQ